LIHPLAPSTSPLMTRPAVLSTVMVGELVEVREIGASMVTRPEPLFTESSPQLKVESSCRLVVKFHRKRRAYVRLYAQTGFSGKEA